MSVKVAETRFTPTNFTLANSASYKQKIIIMWEDFDLKEILRLWLRGLMLERLLDLAITVKGHYKGSYINPVVSMAVRWVARGVI